MIHLAQIIIIILMYIFTPLNMVLFNKMLSVSPAPTSEAGASKERRSTFNLLSGKDKKLKQPNSGFASIIKNVDELIFKPILIRDYENRKVARF